MLFDSILCTHNVVSILGLVLLRVVGCVFNHGWWEREVISLIFCFCFKEELLNLNEVASQWLEWGHILFPDLIVDGGGGGYFRLIRLSPGAEGGGQCP